jgi:hypothetical protein
MMFFKRIWRPVLFTLAVIIYSGIIVVHIFAPNGLLMIVYKCYKINKINQIKLIKYSKKYAYYHQLLIMNKVGDIDGLAIATYLKFHRIFTDYKIEKAVNIKNSN